MTIKPFAIAVLSAMFATLVYAAEPVSGAVEKIASLSPAERSQYATESLTEMQNAQTVLERLDRTDHDCVAQRLPLLNSLIEVSTAAATDMSKWQAQGNSYRADTELRKISAALTKTRALMLEAKACAKDNEGGDGEESRKLEYAGPSLGDDEGTTDLPDYFYNVPELPEASPYM